MIPSERLVADYQKDGVVLIPRFFSAEKIAEIRGEIDRYVRQDLGDKPKDARTLEPDGRNIRNLWRLQQHNTYFRQLAQQTDILGLIERLVGGLPVLQGVETFNKPARVGTAVPYHQDNAYFCQTPPDMLTVWIAIDPVTIDNGPVYFIKGSHKAGTLPTRPSGVTGNSIGLAEPPQVTKRQQFCALLRPGDATIHHCETIHHSDPNETELARLGLLLVYRGSHTETDERLHQAYAEAVAATPPA